jgi:TolB protein
MLSAQQGYLEVTAQGNRQLQLAIAPCKGMGGAQHPEIAKEINEVLQFDLTLAGPFNVVSAAVAEGRSGIRPGEFEFAPWQAAGTEILVKTGYVVAGTT